VCGGTQIRGVQRCGQPGATVGSNDIALYHRGAARLCALECVSEHLFYVVDTVSAINGVQAVAADQVEDVEAGLTTLHQRQEPLMD
jgi:hypothetical protein